MSGGAELIKKLYMFSELALVGCLFHDIYQSKVIQLSLFSQINSKALSSMVEHVTLSLREM